MYTEMNISEEQRESVPKPKGYKLLIAIPSVNDKTKGGIIIPDKLADMEKTASIVGYVVAMGETAYKDETKFPTGPWCQLGEYVIFRSYSGTRIKVDEQEFRLIDDDSVEAVVADPRKIMRAF